MSGLFLGVDGGQSGTTALIGDETGEVLGVGYAGPCNHVSTEESQERFRHAISGVLREASASAGLTGPGFEAACLGLSGGPHDKESLSREIIPASRYVITHDAEIALAGALSGAPGIIAIAGTGSIAFGRSREGETARAGGWGYIFGDEGGAFDLVRQALRAALRHEEGWGPPTRLREAFLKATEAKDVNELMHRFYTPAYPRDRVATYSKLIDDAAKDGDAVSRDLLHGAAQSLATLVAAVKHRLFREDGGVLVSYAGGVFESDAVRERFSFLVELDESSRVQPPQYGPAAGALIEAYKLAELSILPQGGPKGV